MSLLPKRSALIALALVPFFAAGAALADDASTGEHSGAGPRSRPCRGDLQQFCADVQRGGGRILACLKEHEAQLSPACHDALAAHEKAHPNAGAATPPAASSK
jgi:hypothetical protein